MMKNENINTNNIYILDNIYQQQFNINRDIYFQQLRLIYKDLKTIKRIFVIKVIRRFTIQHLYDQYN